MGKRVIITGGSGKVGKIVIEYLLNKGFEILNLDAVPLEEPLSNRVHTLRVDLTDIGQVFSSISSRFKLEEPFREPLGLLPDAVIHLAGYARNMMAPDVETYRVNTQSTYNVLEVSCKLGIRKIILASSMCVYGVTFAEGDIEFPSFPVDEEVDVNPMDVYGITKVCGEQTARGFARKYGVDIYALRLGRVIAPEEFEEYFGQTASKPEEFKVHGWSYIDGRDFAQMCELSVIKDGLVY